MYSLKPLQNERNMIEKFLWVLPLCLWASITLGQDLKRPNIVVFLVDDMGWQDTSVPFWDKTTIQNKHFRTPNMERLTAQAYKFVNAYANPLCTPSRVSLITGANASRHHVTSWTKPDKSSPNLKIGEVDWNTNGVSPVPGIPHTFYATGLPEILRQNGYYTVLSGKGHFGPKDTPAADPRSLGFDLAIASGEFSYPASYYGRKSYDNARDGASSRAAVKDLDSYHGTDIFLTEAITREALKAIDRPVANNQPFFLYLAHYAVHTPIQADSNYVTNYQGKGLAPIDVAYASLVESMDNSLGILMDHLAKKSIDDNTVIIFLSDNGGVSIMPRWQDFAAGNRNAPLRSGKATVYEGGIRIPFLFKDPRRKLESPQEVKQYVQIEDVFSTVLDIAEASNRDSIVQIVDGISLLPFVEDPSFVDSSRVLLWHLPHYKGNSAGWSSAIRKGEWKLIYNYNKEILSLYNLTEDIGEQNDLAATYPLKVEELALAFSELLQERESRFPKRDSLRNREIPLPIEVFRQKNK